MMNSTKGGADFWYLATPYRYYKPDVKAAYILACQNAALLIDAGINVFSPIAHSYGIDTYTKPDTPWLDLDKTFVDVAIGVIVLMAPTWEISAGMKLEIEWANAAGKPIIYMNVGEIPDELHDYMEERNDSNI